MSSAVNCVLLIPYDGLLQKQKSTKSEHDDGIAYLQEFSKIYQEDSNKLSKKLHKKRQLLKSIRTTLERLKSMY